MREREREVERKRFSKIGRTTETKEERKRFIYKDTKKIETGSQRYQSGVAE